MAVKEPPRYIVAVSGGVDSVILLHMLVRQAKYELIIAHFDHGIRHGSAADATFVEELAAKYDVPVYVKREELGEKASEELARTRRYQFLRKLAGQHQAKIMTAHHADDAIESVAINLTRGTGWRGLAVMDSDIIRPLLTFTKDELLAYARKHQLEWREDHTNASDAYLRNRLRPKTMVLDTDIKRQLLALRAAQIDIKQQIDELIESIQFLNSRYYLTAAPVKVAVEILHAQTNRRLTGPQCERALLAIKTAKSGSIFEAGGGVSLRFSTRNFTVELVK
ncbi:MAG: hypothetical protein JWN33_114 [Candidatus Saccharibacteria bacterium]|nr:hypothetical protein [Candidatus Saccharibacteria bacterium]